MAHKTMTREEAVDAIWKLVGSIGCCMFVTWDGERQRARPLIARPSREENRIHFLIDVDDRKDEQIEKFPTVSLAFADGQNHDYLALTGQAAITDDRQKIAELWTGVDTAYWDGADDPSIRLLTVTPEDAEVWLGPDRLTAGAALPGTGADLGESVKVDHL